MSYEIVVALAAFAFVSSITPGPNNLMLMASGANFGLRRTVPHMLGVAIGFTVMIVLVGLGLMELFEAYPASYTVLKVFSVVYLLYLAWKITIATAPNGEAGSGRPLTFIQAALFQWVNPKAWAMALTAISVYAPSKSLVGVLLVAAVFGMINLPSISFWTMLGKQAQRVLTNPARRKIFNGVMALLLVGSLYPVLAW
ncbi:LysE family translocator [Dichotomicrobium thermohalophilum]|uniref:Threonine/homoserine/homoserine lactone efflux protein n=1 Tax=Dichotomicrobium thermohalophilum TaxID=933063 RepID=A0A397PEY4_9HYPH|nr:LysE family translocator [Dichotomicrobium thermohalophilum]RIA47562.1 threonine/homoserine/homoserine lactone efflux protein [Dichotomicrobium thermohalophilum]